MLTRFIHKTVRQLVPVYSVPVVGPLLRRMYLGIVYPAWKRIAPEPATNIWEVRTKRVLSSPDNEHIPRVPQAGEIINGALIMHNGIRIQPESHYGPAMLQLMMRNRGVHEPQQERAFQEVLKVIPSGATMMELGAYWAFYSLWFYRAVAGARCIMVEPDAKNLEYGRTNFALNSAQGEFVQGYVGGKPSFAQDGIRIWTLDELLATHRVEQLHLLHVDIQGAEMELLENAGHTLAQRQIDFIFLSTHSITIHATCARRLRSNGYTILVDIDLAETDSYDGLLVARRAELSVPASIEVSK